jgi:hypothetical protein
MLFFAEPLECRRLFAAAPIPAAVAAAYGKLIQDDAALTVDLKKYTAALSADVKVLVADVKKLAKTKGNTALASTGSKDAAAVVAGDTSATNTYVTRANAAFKSFELAAAAFTAKATLANGKKLTAADRAVSALESANQQAPISTQIAKASNGADDLVTTLTSLSAGNPNVAKLLADVQAASTDVDNLSNIQGDAGDAAQADIPALLSS